MCVIVELGNHRREVEFAERGMDIGGTLVGWRFVIKEGCPPLFGVGAKVLGSRLTAVGEVFQGRLPSVDANPLVMVPPLIRGTSQGRSRSLSLHARTLASPSFATSTRRWVRKFFKVDLDAFRLVLIQSLATSISISNPVSLSSASDVEFRVRDNEPDIEDSDSVDIRASLLTPFPTPKDPNEEVDGLG